MKIIIAFLILLSGGTTAMAQTAKLKQVANGRVEGALTAFTSGGGRSILPLLDISLYGNYADGKVSKSGLLVIFDPHSHFFFWEHSLGVERPYGYRNGVLAAYADNTELTVFRVLPGRTHIYVRQADEKADSLYDAESKAMEGARSQLGTQQSSQWYGWHEVPLKELSTEFTISKYSAAPVGKWPAIVDVSHPDDSWEVTLEAFWKEKITMNDKFEVTRLERLP